MATTISFCFSLNSQNNHHHSRRRQLQLPFSTPFIHESKHPLLNFRKFDRFSSFPSLSCSNSPPSTTTTTPPPPPPSPPPTTTTTTPSYLEDPLRTGRFLTNEELDKLQILENFSYFQELKGGSMWVRVMKAEEMDSTVGLLSESFAESMLLPKGYVSLLGFLVKQYLTERRALMPHTATLIGFYKGNEQDGELEEGELAGTVEVSFDKRGANASPPTPTPPKNSPYVCNMTVKKPLRRIIIATLFYGYGIEVKFDYRCGYVFSVASSDLSLSIIFWRRGIGWHLLKASEELISQMSSSREVYLHCRMIDEAPFNMYRKAGYEIVNTDSIFILLTLQRRKHLMCKRLLVLENPSEMDTSESDEELSSRLDDVQKL